MAYEKTEWKAREGSGLNRFAKSDETAGSVVLENAPYEVTEPGTPFSTNNMNRIERGISDAHDLIAAEAQARIQGDAGTLEAVGAHAASAAAHADIRALFDNLTGLPQWDSGNHVITFTAKNGATMEIDLPLESLARDIGYDAGSKEVILIREDGSEIRVSVSDLVDTYEGSAGAHIQVTVENNVIKAKALAGAFGETELAPALLAKINGKLDALQKGAAGGVASLDGDGKIPAGQLPEFGGNDVYALLDQKAPLAGPAFSGIPTLVPGKTTAAENDGTLIATEAQVCQKKKYAALVIGTVQAGHTAGDVDYLCTGANDHDVINAAIAALPFRGGEIVIREGQYEINGRIVVNNSGAVIRGCGYGTVLMANANIADADGGLINVTGNDCGIRGLNIMYLQSNVANGICVSGANNRITGNRCRFAGDTGVCRGIYVTGANNIISGNACLNISSVTCYGICVTGANNIISGNTCSNECDGAAFCYGIGVTGEGNAVTGNIIKNFRTGPGPTVFALHISDSAHYCAVHGNNLRGVTGKGGAAYTVNGTATANIPAGAASVVTMNTGGSCGFNIV